MSKVFVFLLLVTSILPISSSKKIEFENKIKGRFNLQASSQAVKDESSTAPKLASFPVKTDNSGDISTGKAQIVTDLASGAILEEKNADARLQVASLTKLMTAYTVLKDLDLDKTMTVGKMNLQAGDAVMGVFEGEKLKIRTMVKGMLINSGSDAAQALAIEDAGSLDKFADKMNQNAAALNLTNSHFTNPVGWDDKNNYSTARDISNLARVMLGNKEFREITSTKSTTVYTESGRAIALTNTNVLLGENGFWGVKTGYTPGAGECLASLRKDGDREILTVILGSTDRFGQTRSLLDWIYKHFSW